VAQFSAQTVKGQGQGQSCRVQWASRRTAAYHVGTEPTSSLVWSAAPKSFIQSRTAELRYSTLLRT